MDDSTKKVSVLELRRLLVELKEHRPDICIRYRLLGKMWSQDFLHILRVTDRGAILSYETLSRLISLPDLSQIVQFELDKPFQLYQPYFHFDVYPSPEW